MTTASATVPVRVETRPGLMRLTAVELRKMTDTRAGFWLLVTIVVLTVALVGVVAAVGKTADQTFREMFVAALGPASILMPIVGILLVSSEWMQRTAQITFTFVPQRPRIVAAKVLAGVALALAVVVIAFPLAAIGTAVAAPDVELAWSLPIGFVLQSVVSVVTGMVIGIAFGAVLLASAPAIVLYFALPLALSVLGSLPALEGVARWVDGSLTLAPLTEHMMSGTEWARAGVTLAVWMLLPLAIGTWRIVRSEVR